jgi:tripartite-type tricarboxylate transporter receptor subunit TctC
VSIRIIITIVSYFFCAICSAQQAFPTKPIRIIAPFAPGGTTDILSRILGQKLTESWGQQVVVDTRPGASGTIGTDIVAKATPDGYTVGMFISTHAVNPFVLKDLPYDTKTAFAPITLVAVVPGVMVMNPGVGASNLQQVIALAKAKPGQFSYAAAGTLSSGQLTMELLKQIAGIDIQMVPYKGGGAVLTDLIGGQVQFSIGGPPPVLPYIKSGRLKAIATTGAKRSPGLPDVPTVAESGFPGFETYEWYGLFAPAAVPKGILAKLSDEMVKILRLPDVNRRMLDLGAEPVGNSPREFAQFIDAEMQRWGPLAKKLNLSY